MRFRVLATDYDNTIALRGVVGPVVHDALRRVAASGRRLVLVTGRTMQELRSVFDDFPLFDAMVLENGALLHLPRSGEQRLLAAAVPERLVAELDSRQVAPLSVGSSLVSTAEPNAAAVLAAIQDLGLDLHLIYNRDSVMVLPRGTDKVLGLRAAAAELGEDMAAVVAVGDGENDSTMLRAAGCGVAVENAVPEARAAADLVLEVPGPEGFSRLCDSLAEADLAGLAPGSASR